jgi:hypothetical protein
MPGLDAVTATIPLPLWAAGAFAALFVGAVVLALRASTPSRSLAALVGLVVAVAVAWATWSSGDGAARREQAAQRRALDARATELSARAIMPSSALACLDANAGETVEGACEKSLFASPEAVAAATSYVAARLLLLADGVAYARADRGYEAALAGLRRSMESDRFGLVAHVLASRDACTPEHCETFALLRDAEVIKANLKAHTYENNVTRYAAVWSESKAAPVAAAAPAPAAPAVAAVPSSIIFPSAASIPPVSIMNPEPVATAPAPAPAEPSAAAARRPPAAAPPPARRPSTNGAATPPAQPAPAPSAAASPRAP